MKILLLSLPLAVGLLVACAPTSQLQLSSGRIGCPSSEIVVGDVASTRRSESWSATCRGQTYFCSATDDFREVICRPQLKLAAPAAPAPVVVAPTPTVVAAPVVAPSTAPAEPAVKLPDDPAASDPTGTVPLQKKDSPASP